MIIITLILALQETQCQLFNEDKELVGWFSYTNDQAWLVIKGNQPDTFRVHFIHKYRSYIVMYISNDTIHGSVHIRLDRSSLQFNLLINNKTHYDETFHVFIQRYNNYHGPNNLDLNTKGSRAICH